MQPIGGRLLTSALAYHQTPTEATAEATKYGVLVQQSTVSTALSETFQHEDQHAVCTGHIIAARPLSLPKL